MQTANISSAKISALKLIW